MSVFDERVASLDAASVFAGERLRSADDDVCAAIGARLSDEAVAVLARRASVLARRQRRVEFMRASARAERFLAACGDDADGERALGSARLETWGLASA